MAEIILYGIIGDPFDKLDAKTIAPLIRAASGPLTLRINSPGGYVMEGLAIIAAIRDYRGKVTPKLPTAERPRGSSSIGRPTMSRR